MLPDAFHLTICSCTYSCQRGPLLKISNNPYGFGQMVFILVLIQQQIYQITFRWIVEGTDCNPACHTSHSFAWGKADLRRLWALFLQTAVSETWKSIQFGSTCTADNHSQLHASGLPCEANWNPVTWCRTPGVQHVMESAPIYDSHLGSRLPFEFLCQQKYLQSAAALFAADSVVRGFENHRN